MGRLAANLGKQEALPFNSLTNNKGKGLSDLFRQEKKEKEAAAQIHGYFGAGEN